MTRMKESGIDWIGQIPEEWESGKVKYFSKISAGATPDRNNLLFWNGDINWMSSGEVNQEIVKYTAETITNLALKKSSTKLLPIGTVMLAMNGQGKTKGTVAILAIETASNQSLASFIVDGNRLNNQYLYYFFKAGYSYIRGLKGEDRDGLNLQLVSNITVLLFDIKEQQKIADFLDKKTTQLDKVKSLLEEQIQKLKDYRSSLIYETVTKGLDKTVPMKDSGIDWIGQVPEGWGVSRLKYYFDIYAGGDIDERNTVEEYSESHPYPVLSNSLENEGVLGYTNKYRFKKNCVTVTGRGDVGKAVYRNIKFYPVVRLLVCVPKSQVDCRFVTYWINSAIIEKNQTAVSQLTIQMLRELIFVNVPFLEQKNIADFLDKKTNQIDKLIQIKNQQIDNINKQRQTLIYDYVTGKKRA